MNTPRALSSGWEPPEPPQRPPQQPLGLPNGLPELPSNPRVLLLIDVDCVSYGLVEGTGRRACDKALRACLELVHATAASVDPRYRTRARRALSSATAKRHLDVLISAPSNSFTVRYGAERGGSGAGRRARRPAQDPLEDRPFGTRAADLARRLGDARRPRRDLRTTGRAAASARDSDLAACGQRPGGRFAALRCLRHRLHRALLPWLPGRLTPCPRTGSLSIQLPSP